MGPIPGKGNLSKQLTGSSGRWAGRLRLLRQRATAAPVSAARPSIRRLVARQDDQVSQVVSEPEHRHGRQCDRPERSEEQRA
jgi:hypothetical protein